MGGPGDGWIVHALGGQECPPYTLTSFEGVLFFQLADGFGHGWQPGGLHADHADFGARFFDRAGDAANEAAVSRFLAGEIAFLDITKVCREVLNHHHFSPRPTLAELSAADRWARQEVARWTPCTTIRPLTT